MSEIIREVRVDGPDCASVAAATGHGIAMHGETSGEPRERVGDAAFVV